jgi:hypothetical protein
MENTMKMAHAHNVQQDGSTKVSDIAKNVLPYPFRIGRPQSVKVVHQVNKK